MTVSTEVTRVIVEGDGVTTTQSYSFPIPGSSNTDQTNAELILTGTNGLSTTLATNLWSITGVVLDATDGVGGTFVYPLSGSPLTSGNFLTLNRIVPYTQPTELGSQGAYSPTVVMNALDWLALQTEQLNTRMLQTVHAPITDDALADLPSAVNRANSFLYFDSNGDPTTASSTGGMPSSIFVGNTASTTTYLTQTLLLDGATLTHNGSTTTASVSGGGSITVTDGSNTVSAATRIIFSGATVGGSTPNATVAVSGGSGGGAGVPQGRLTLTSGSAVMTSDVSTSSTVYYRSFVGNQVPVWDGSTMQSLTITGDEISTGLDSGGLCPINHVFDIFGISVSGVLTIGYIGWTSTSGRGTGGSTAELTLQNGIWVNKNAITLFSGVIGQTNNSVTAKKGTYIGSFYTTHAGQTTWIANPAAAVAGGACILGVYNGYNRISIASTSRDSTGSWTYGTASWRPANLSTNNRITYLDGLAQSDVYATYVQAVQTDTTAANLPSIGVVIDSSSANPNDVASFGGFSPGVSAIGSLCAASGYAPLLGLHYIQAMEQTFTAGTATYYGQPSAGQSIQALIVQLQM